jgi:hypothetical protein
MKTSLWLLLALVPLGGCAGRVFTEADNRQTVQVDVGSTFSISVPAPAGPAPTPAFAGTILKADKGVPEDGRLRYEFQALGQGETEVRIGPEFALRVRVVSASSRPGMPMNRP